MKDKLVVIKKLAVIILAGIGAFTSVLYILNFKWGNPKSMPVYYNPHHAKNGIDTVHTDDSFYVIKVSILQEDHNPQDERSPAEKL